MIASPFGTNIDPYADYDPGDPVSIKCANPTCGCEIGDNWCRQSPYDKDEFYCLACEDVFLQMVADASLRRGVE